ncbi:MAG: bacillithiol biosynthesis cysteine-adding enzyme BshC [bacterium]
MRASAHVPVAGVPGANALFQAYIEHFEKLSGFYQVDYRSFSALGEHASAIAASAYPRRQVAAILAKQNERWGASDKTRHHLAALAEANSIAVVTGQQVGLFGGPLFTLYKALTCLKLAERLSAQLQRTVVPIFWLASDDDDLAEVNRTTVLTRENTLLTLSADLAGEARRPMFQIDLPGSIRETQQKLTEAISDSEFKSDILPALFEAYAPGRSLPEAFARWMSFLTGAFGLVLLDPTDPAFKQLAVPVFSKELNEQSPSTTMASNASAALELAGYTPQVSLRAGRCNLFYVDRERHALEGQDGAFATTDGALRLPKEEWLQRIRQSPASFSPNVVLRPIVQDAILPTVAYVAGPAEIAYFAQLRGVYESFGIRMPAIFPRQMLTLMEKKIQHVLEKYDLGIIDFWQNSEQLISRVARRQTPEGLLEPVAAARAALSESLAALKERAVALDPTLAAFLDKEQGKILHQLETIEKKIVQASKLKNETLQQQLEKGSRTFYPHQHLQERELNLISFFCKYGKSMIHQLYDVLNLDSFQHQIVEI